ncbi:MAG TPA: hypothetical protein DEA97_18200 [Bacteroidales bacterium]|nr:MAG: hypothetical protein UR43_C0009G0017 [candidate division TM6 bacterium GW2011_GWF2_33_332]OFY79201.1 MAG: hypothetical protein A2281_14655 [Bacteroidetes bacterium RIFOXYA12_FULL_38_20]HBS88497.1 hypothetical protein [Bacteroidales bacterium]
MKRKILFITAGIIILFNLGMNIYHELKPEKKIGFVRSESIVYEYAGTKEIQNRYNEKLQLWQAQLDTLKQDYNQLLDRYNLQIGKMGEMEKKEFQAELKYKHDNVVQQQQNIEMMSREEEEKMMSGVLNQINSFILQYGKDKGYTIIMGTVNEGNILYGEDAIDLTDEILTELNKNYSGV